MRPRDGSPTLWPARPTRCSPLATEPGRGDLHDEVDGAHVDAELERRGGDDARQRARLERLLDLAARLARERAVVGAGDRLLGELVEPQREPLGHAAAVDEDDRRVVRRARARAARGRARARASASRRRSRPARRRAARLGSASVRVGGHLDAQVELLAHARVDDAHVAVAADEARDLLERALRGRERDALRIAARRASARRSSESARCAPRLVAATACTSSTITASMPVSISRAREVSSR